MMLKINDLHTGYHKKEIVKGISFTINAGDFTCIIGANGCGKTTTIKGILGLLPLYAGTVSMEGKIFIDGHSGHLTTAKERAKAFAYIPQIHGLPFPFKVADVVLLGRTPHLKSSVSMPTEKDKMIAWKALNTLGIESIANQEYTELSGGQQQLVLIARALAQEPKVLIMDEPTASLDFGNQQLVLEQLMELGRTGMSVLMVTHDPHHVLLCANKVIVMDDGLIIKEGTPEQTITTGILEQIYGAQAVVATVQLPGGAETKTVVPVSKNFMERR